MKRAHLLYMLYSCSTRIIRLSLQGCIHIDAEMFSRLPNSLEYLNLLDTNIALDRGRALPRTLKRLKLGWRSGRTVFQLQKSPHITTQPQVATGVNNRALTHLPPSLISLTYVSVCCSILEQVMLTMLILPLHQSNRLCNTAVLTWGLAALPPSLKRLKLEGKSTIADKSLRHVPHTLTWLILTGCTQVSEEGTKAKCLCPA